MLVTKSLRIIILIKDRKILWILEVSPFIGWESFLGQTGALVPLVNTIDSSTLAFVCLQYSQHLAIDLVQEFF